MRQTVPVPLYKVAVGTGHSQAICNCLGSLLPLIAGNKAPRWLEQGVQVPEETQGGNVLKRTPCNFSGAKDFQLLGFPCSGTGWRPWGRIWV